MGELLADVLIYDQITIGVAPTLIVEGNSMRRGLVLVQEGSTDIRIGDVNVTTGTGLLLLGTKGSALSLPTSAAVYGIAASPVGLSFMELF